MRYRKLQGFGQGIPVDGGDYSFGGGTNNFWVDDPQGVAQAVLTALLLHQGEWFLNIDIGMPWETQVEGYNTQSLYDSAIKQNVLAVQGVKAILSYSSDLDPSTRHLNVQMVLDTIYGSTGQISASIPAPPIYGYGIGPYGDFATA